MRLPEGIFRVLTAVILSVAAPVGRAGTAAPGEWRHFPAYAMPVSGMAETDRYVLTLAAGSLFCYDKKLDERMALTPDNLLSRTNVDAIFHDPAGDRVLVAYGNGALDLLELSGEYPEAFFIPDIADAAIEGSRRINDADFRSDTLTLATDFGLVRIDCRRRETLASGRYGKAVTGVASCGDRLLIATDGKILSAPCGARINSPDNFSPVADAQGVAEIVSTGTGALVRGSGELLRVRPEADGEVSVKRVAGYRKCSPLSVGADGAARYIADGRFYEVDADGVARYIAAAPEKASAGAMTAFSWPGWMWVADLSGISKMSLAGGKWSVSAESWRPEALSVARVAYIIPAGSGGERVYLVNLGPTNYRLGTGGTDAVDQPQAATVMDAASGEMTDVTAWPVRAAHSVPAGYQPRTGEYALSTTRLLEDPDDPATYWLGTGNDGLLKITGGKPVGRYDAHNSPLPEAWGTRVFEIQADPEENLWVTAQGTADNTGIAILPAAMRRRDPATAKASDWIRVDIDGLTANKDMRMLICRQSNMIFLTDATPGVMLTAIDTRGTYGDPTDDIVKVWTSFTDQDGKNFAPTRHTSLAEDHDGRVWLGTNMGIAEIASPADAVNPSMRIVRLKVARDDGSGLADYLCESDLVYDISVDHANRKWIATDGSGLYLVDARGENVIENLTTANSQLPSNRVDAVYADALSNAVYIATEQGFCAYGGDASPAAEDFSEVLAYPNPVEPGYSGYVTITGLMDGSLVKITDASGRVVWQGNSEGGMARWNCCDGTGRRVRSGVYFVLLSRSGEGLATRGSVSRITVIN